MIFKRVIALSLLLMTTMTVCAQTEDSVEVNKKKWIEQDDFLDLLAIAQSAPGILAVNIAIFVGYRLRGVKGSLVTSLGSILPSFLMILAIALFFSAYKDNPYVEKVFKGIRPAVVALIAAPVFRMGKKAKLTWTTIWIPVVAALLIWLMGVSPIWIIIMAGVGGYLYGRWNNNGQKPILGNGVEEQSPEEVR